MSVETVEMVCCPNCGGDGIGGIQPVCCRRPHRNGECCGDPELEQYPCGVCEGYGFVEYHESAAPRLLRTSE